MLPRRGPHGLGQGLRGWKEAGRTTRLGVGECRNAGLETAGSRMGIAMSVLFDKILTQTTL